MYIKADSATEAFEMVLKNLSGAKESSPRGFKIKEILNCCIEITNPLNRLIQTPKRKMSMPFAVGEFLWYIAGKNDLRTMQYYSKRMANFSDDGKTLNSAYGYRIFGKHPQVAFDQWENVKRILRKDPDSRQAVIHLHTPNDKDTKDEVCTLGLQFLIREGKLSMITNMRSNDIMWGFTYDVFSFTMLMEIMANELGLELGTYYHNAGSMHIYERDFKMLSQSILDYDFKPFAMDRNMMKLGDYKDLIAFECIMRNSACIEDHFDYFVKNIATSQLTDIIKIFMCALYIKGLEANNANVTKFDKVINFSRLVDENYADILAGACKSYDHDAIKIIVDGIDGAGKSSLIAAIEEKLDPYFKFNIQSYKKPSKHFKYYDNYGSALSSEVNTIFDRFFTSEYVYSTSMQRENNLPSRQIMELIRESIKRQAIFIIFAFDSVYLKQVATRTSKEDTKDYGAVAYLQNILYNDLAHGIMNQNGKIFVINDPNYSINEMANKIVSEVCHLLEVGSKNV